MSGWLSRHLQALLFAAGRLARAPLGTLLTILVIAVALTLPASFALLVGSVRSVTRDLANAVDVTVYFRHDVSLDAVQKLASSTRSRAGVAQVKVIPAEQALADFRRDSGFGQALEALTDNPLPHAMDVRPTATATHPEDLEALKAQLAASPEVELVQIDSEWVLRLNAILDLLRRIVLGSAVLLGLGVVAVIGNTLRMEIDHRRAEIEVTKLVGGSNAFVRRPFLYTGGLYGLLGGMLASALMGISCRLLAEPVARLAQSYGSEFTLATPSLAQIGQLLAVGVGLGLVGAFLSTSRHLSRIEPRV